MTLDQFTVTPASTQAGSHPDVTIFQHVKGKTLARTVVVPIAMKDERGKVTTLRVRVRRG